MLGSPLKARHLRRYAELGRLFLRFRRGLDGESLARELERQGPTFVKLGQLLSTRSDFLPEEHIAALSRLQDDVEPLPGQEIERLAETELGTRLNKAFAEFDRRPLAAASLAQIHKARLHDGTVVAVKVQRPGVRRRFEEDLQAIGEAAAFLDKRTRLGRRYEFRRMIEEVKLGLFRELDYRQEARNLRAIRANLAGFTRLIVPRPYEDYSTERILTMDYVEGKKITDLSPLARTETDGPALAEDLFRAYLQQILVDGLFHGDPHPGNVLVTPGRKVALVDLGLAVRLPPGLQEDLLTLLLAISEGRAEDAADSALRLGQAREEFDREAFFRRIGQLVLRNKDATIEDLDVGRIVMEITSVSAECGVRLPPEMTAIGRALMNLDRAVWTLDPGFRPAEVIKREAATLVQQRLQGSTTRGGLYSGLLEIKKFAEAFPDRAGRILDNAAHNNLRVRVHAFDEIRLISGLQKIANRIATGLVLCALIIGGSMLMDVERPLALLMLAVAGAGGVILAVDAAAFDERKRDR